MKFNTGLVMSISFMVAHEIKEKISEHMHSAIDHQYKLYGPEFGPEAIDMLEFDILSKSLKDVELQSPAIIEKAIDIYAKEQNVYPLNISNIYAKVIVEGETIQKFIKSMVSDHTWQYKLCADKKVAEMLKYIDEQINLIG